MLRWLSAFLLLLGSICLNAKFTPMSSSVLPKKDLLIERDQLVALDIELERQAKIIANKELGSQLDDHPIFHTRSAEIRKALANLDFRVHMPSLVNEILLSFIHLQNMSDEKQRRLRRLQDRLAMAMPWDDNADLLDRTNRRRNIASAMSAGGYSSIEELLDADPNKVPPQVLKDIQPFHEIVDQMSAPPARIWPPADPDYDGIRPEKARSAYIDAGVPLLNAIDATDGKEQRQAIIELITSPSHFPTLYSDRITDGIIRGAVQQEQWEEYQLTQLGREVEAKEKRYVQLSQDYVNAVNTADAKAAKSRKTAKKVPTFAGLGLIGAGVVFVALSSGEEQLTLQVPNGKSASEFIAESRDRLDQRIRKINSRLLEIDR